MTKTESKNAAHPGADELAAAISHAENELLKLMATAERLEATAVEQASDPDAYPKAARAITEIEDEIAAKRVEIGHLKQAGSLARAREFIAIGEEINRAKKGLQSEVPQMRLMDLLMRAEREIRPLVQKSGNSSSESLWGFIKGCDVISQEVSALVSGTVPIEKVRELVGLQLKITANRLARLRVAPPGEADVLTRMANVLLREMSNGPEDYADLVRAKRDQLISRAEEIEREYAAFNAKKKELFEELDALKSSF